MGSSYPLAVAGPLYVFYRALCATLRFHEENREELDCLHTAGERLIFCLWHDELLPLMRMKRQLDIVTVVSPSHDGELLARILEKLGLRTVRGSSGRGGTHALLGAARLMKKEHIHACVTVDGPRGPRHKAKNGAFFLAHHADAYIAPVRIIMNTAYRFHSWDRFQFPLPFSKVTVRHGKPWKLSGDVLSEENLLAARTRLEADLAALAPERPEATTLPNPITPASCDSCPRDDHE